MTGRFFVRVGLLTAAIQCCCTLTWSQFGDGLPPASVSGNVGVLWQSYAEDSLIGAVVPPSKTGYNAFANVLYNQTFRALFLKTIKPTSLYEKFLAWNVVFNTSLFNNVETFVGQRNVIYLILGCAVSYITGNNFIFFIMTSFIHYLSLIHI